MEEICLPQTDLSVISLLWLYYCILTHIQSISGVLYRLVITVKPAIHHIYIQILSQLKLHNPHLLGQYTCYQSFKARYIAGIRGTVIARWTTGRQVERSILRQGHDS